MEDSLDIIAKLPAIAALIYTNVYKGGHTIQADSKLDWAANLSHMMGMRSAQCGLWPWSCMQHSCVQGDYEKALVSMLPVRVTNSVGDQQHCFIPSCPLQMSCMLLPSSGQSGWIAPLLVKGTCLRQTSKLQKLTVCNDQVVHVSVTGISPPQFAACCASVCH